MKRDDRGHLLLEPGDVESVDSGLAVCATCDGGEAELEERCESRCHRLRRNEHVLRATNPLKTLVVCGPENSSGIRPVMATIDPNEILLARAIVRASNSGRLRWRQ